MTGCAEPGSRVWLSKSDNPARKYPCSWELVEVDTGHCACIHSSRANQLVVEAIENGRIAELQPFDSLRTEVRFGKEGSRVDILLEAGARHCFIEVKSVTLSAGDGLGLFPDAVSVRGQKHLRELGMMAADGHRAVLMFAVLHTGIERVAPADSIDPDYGELFRSALAMGVEAIAYGCRIDAGHIELVRPLPVLRCQPQ